MINQLTINKESGEIRINDVVILLNQITHFKEIVIDNNIEIKSNDYFGISLDVMMNGYKVYVKYAINQYANYKLLLFPLFPKHPKEQGDSFAIMDEEVTKYYEDLANNFIKEVFGGNNFIWGKVEIREDNDPHYSSGPWYSGILITFFDI